MFRRFRFGNALKYLEVASLCTAAAAIHAQSLDRHSLLSIVGERFQDFLGRITAQDDTAEKKRIVDAYLEKVKSLKHPVIEDSTVYFLYRGSASRVGVPADFNGWNPIGDTMSRIEGTDLFCLMKSFDAKARFEYKFVVDTTWMLDPLNSQQAIGGYGPNSEIWMPDYVPPGEIAYRDDIPHGRLDTLSIKSSLLKRTHTVFVYTPPGYRTSHVAYPAIYVTDGGEYITLALMINVLENLMAEKRIEPIAAIFIDPRTNIRDSRTSTRMYDYTMKDTFVNFVKDEVRDRVLSKYRVSADPRVTAIMGASLGGLIATYAAYSHPDVFGLCAAQSPSYWWNAEAMISMIAQGPRKPLKLYIDTGTIRDAQAASRKMRDVLHERGYEFLYAEHPDSHSWANWRAHIDDILIYFYGIHR
jgi:enterochelin esterase family protein